MSVIEPGQAQMEVAGEMVWVAFGWAVNRQAGGNGLAQPKLTFAIPSRKETISFLFDPLAFQRFAKDIQAAAGIQIGP